MSRFSAFTLTALALLASGCSDPRCPTGRVQDGKFCLRCPDGSEPRRNLCIGLDGGVVEPTEDSGEDDGDGDGAEPPSAHEGSDAGADAGRPRMDIDSTAEASVPSIDVGALPDSSASYDAHAAVNDANVEAGTGETDGAIDASTPAAASMRIAAGPTFACAVLQDGSISCWGRNEAGQLGVTNPDLGATPLVVPNVAAAVHVAAGYSAACAALANGTVKCWGTLGLYDSARPPTAVALINDAVEVAVGFDSACARLKDGTVKCWGDNSKRQLGDGTIQPRSGPVTVAGVVGATSISMGALSGMNCAVLSSGPAMCWGLVINRADMQEPANPAIRFPDAKAISAGKNATCVVLGSGKMECIGDASTLGSGAMPAHNTTVYDPVAVTGISTGVAAAAGLNHVCALLRDSTVRCWGLNSGTTIPGGTLGTLSSAQFLYSPAAVSTLDDAVQIAAGEDFTCAIRKSAEISCWGMNDNHQLGGGTTATSSAQPVVVQLPRR